MFKVIAFYGGYLPGKKYGGPVSSLFNFVELLGDNIEIYLVCSNHDLGDKTPYPDIMSGWNNVGKAKVRYLKDGDMTYSTYAKIVDEVSPALIYISSLFSAQFNKNIYTVAKRKKIPVLLAPRGELNRNALLKGKIKKKLYLLYLRVFRILSGVYFQATSDDEYDDIIQMLHVTHHNVFLLPNVPAIPKKKACLKKENGQLKLCFVGRIVCNKNLLICLRSLLSVKTRVLFDIYGAKEDAAYWDECEYIIAKMPPNVLVRYCGVLDQMSMRKRYADYDCLISPTKFENYGQSIVEAMVHDTPVIISKNTTPWNKIEPYLAGFVVDLSNEEGFAVAIEKIGNMDTNEYSILIGNLRKFVADTFVFSELKDMYCNTFNIINRNYYFHQ